MCKSKILAIIIGSEKLLPALTFLCDFWLGCRITSWVAILNVAKTAPLI